MEVRDIFALRKEGRIEEAYNLIRERYRNYHGYHTTLCMFWCASDMLQLYLERGNTDEALRILRALEHILPTMPDDEVIGKQMLRLRKMCAEHIQNGEKQQK